MFAQKSFNLDPKSTEIQHYNAYIRKYNRRYDEFQSNFSSYDLRTELDRYYGKPIKQIPPLRYSFKVNGQEEEADVLGLININLDLLWLENIFTTDNFIRDAISVTGGYIAFLKMVMSLFSLLTNS